MEKQIRRRRFLGWAAASFALASTGCVGGEQTEPEEVDVAGGTTVVFEGHASGWLGVEPTGIDGIRNPTLVLEDGETYVFRWTNGDGAPHDIGIRDADDDVVDGLVSDRVTTKGEETSLEFTASQEMEEYVCSFHRSSQSGRLVVE